MHDDAHCLALIHPIETTQSQACGLVFSQHAAKDKRVDVRFVNPIIRATTSLFSQMLRTQLQLGKPGLAPRRPYSGITGVIEIRGGIMGTIALNLSNHLAIAAASTLREEKLREVNLEVIDAIGEMVNIIAGQAKSELAAHKLVLGLPSVLKDRLHMVKFSGNPIVRVPLYSQWGPLTIDFSMVVIPSKEDAIPAPKIPIYM